MKNKKIIFIIILILLIGSLSFSLYKYMEYLKTDDYQLKKIGYNKKEIELIKTLNKKDIKIVKSKKYNKNIKSLILEEEFDKKQFQYYLSYQTENKTTSKETIFIINNKLNEDEKYDKKNLNSYMKFIKQHKLDPKTSIELVNAKIPYSDIINSLQKEKYYKFYNLIRYINYYNKTKKQTVDIVRDVNSKIDYDFYTNVIDTDMSKDDLVLVNKFHKLDENYEPEDLVIIEGNQYAKKVTALAYQKMKTDAAKVGLDLAINSAYRSYETQNIIYNRYKSQNGLAWADSYSARPGYSEHQTGLALDITSNSSNFDTFENTKEFTWLQDNAHKYGFFLRYGKNKEYITGYNYESWHYRYVGVDVATKIYNENITYEEYYEYYINK